MIMSFRLSTKLIWEAITIRSMNFFYFIINFAVGGNFPGPVDANTVFPQWLIVDYIRVYQN